MSYSKEKLIEEIKRISEEYFDGNTPTKEEMFTHSKIDKIHYNRFDSWNEALNQADLKENIRLETPPEEKLIKEIHRVSEDYCNGRSPRMRDIDEYSNFSSSTYRRVFGGWNDVLEELGYETNNFYVPRDKILSDLERISEKYEYKAPTMDECEKEGYFDYSTGLISDKFGSWKDAWKKVGLKANSRFDEGKDHWSWKGGDYHDYGHSWEKQREKCLERDGFSCRVCGEEIDEMWRSNPDIHHIKPVRKWNVQEEHQKMNSLDNLISLCRTCHHKLEGKWQESSPEEFERKSKNYLDSGTDGV